MTRRLNYTFLFVVFFAITSFGQSFSMSELIRMSNMNNDSFDTYVSSKGYVFIEEKNNKNNLGNTYALNPTYGSTVTSEKFISLYSRYHNYLKAVTYQTIDTKEYVRIKSQVKALGFKLIKSSPETFDGYSSMMNVYRKGKAEITLFADKSYEITYTVDY